MATKDQAPATASAPDTKTSALLEAYTTSPQESWEILGGRLLEAIDLPSLDNRQGPLGALRYQVPEHAFTLSVQSKEMIHRGMQMQGEIEANLCLRLDNIEETLQTQMQEVHDHVDGMHEEIVGAVEAHGRNLAHTSKIALVLAAATAVGVGVLAVMGLRRPKSSPVSEPVSYDPALDPLYNLTQERFAQMGEKLDALQKAIEAKAPPAPPAPPAPQMAVQTPAQPAYFMPPMMPQPYPMMMAPQPMGEDPGEL